MVRSLQARESWLRSIEREFGILSHQEAAELHAGQGAAIRVISLHRGDTVWIPRFQFTDGRQIRPVIPLLIRMARSAGWDNQDLLVWLTNPDTRFPDEKRPVDLLSETGWVLEVLEAKLEEC